MIELGKSILSLTLMNFRSMSVVLYLSSRSLLILLLGYSFIFLGCQPEDEPPAPVIDLSLVDMRTALAQKDTVYVGWIDRVRGRVGRNSNGSFVVWSRRNEYQLGLVISAVHVLGTGWFGEENVDIPARFWYPEGKMGVVRLSLPPSDGSMVLNKISPLYNLFNPFIPASENKDHLTGILPAHDFFIGLVDNQSFPASDGPAPLPDSFQKDEPLSMYDPGNYTLQDPTWQLAQANDSVMLIGFPQDINQYPEGAVGLGKILSDTEARATVERLKSIGDEEGSIAYDPSVEIIIAAAAIAGMSGGGVFNQEGQLVGIIVRSTNALDIGYVRAVRMSYIITQIRQVLLASPTDQEQLAPYLDKEIDF